MTGNGMYLAFERWQYKKLTPPFMMPLYVKRLGLSPLRRPGNPKGWADWREPLDISRNKRSHRQKRGTAVSHARPRDGKYPSYLLAGTYGRSSVPRVRSEDKGVLHRGCSRDNVKLSIAEKIRRGRRLPGHEHGATPSQIYAAV